MSESPPPSVKPPLPPEPGAKADPGPEPKASSNPVVDAKPKAESKPVDDAAAKAPKAAEAEGPSEMEQAMNSDEYMVLCVTNACVVLVRRSDQRIGYILHVGDGHPYPPSPQWTDLEHGQNVLCAGGKSSPPKKNSFFFFVRWLMCVRVLQRVCYFAGTFPRARRVLRGWLVCTTATFWAIWIYLEMQRACALKMICRCRGRSASICALRGRRRPFGCGTAIRAAGCIVGTRCPCETRGTKGRRENRRARGT